MILQFNFFVVFVKYLCNGRCRITITHFLVVVLTRLLPLQCNCNVLSSFQMFCNQNSHSIQTNSLRIQTEIYNSVTEYLTLQMQRSAKMQGFRISMKTCNCKGFCDCISPCFKPKIKFSMIENLNKTKIFNHKAEKIHEI